MQPDRVICKCGWKTYTSTARLCSQCGELLAVDLTNQRVARVMESTMHRKRLLSWLMFFRRPSDRGVGDTAERMFLQAHERDIAQLLKRLLSSCNCRTEDAAEHLNKQYPYA